MSASISPNVIAELNAPGDTVREYIWLPEAEIAPTRQGRAQVDRPIAAITGVNTASPATLYVHVDHLNRPVSMTNASKASVWDAVWTPWGAPYSIIGSETLDARFPGQWFQLEAGLNYNWHRHYDPTTGRYTQPDPLGFVDGPSVYSYAKNIPQEAIDPDGLRSDGPLRPLGPPDIDAPNYIPQLPFLWPFSPPNPKQSFPESGMPPILPPEKTGGGDCSCRCRAGNPNDVTSYRFAERSAPTCAAAAKDACKAAGEYCSTAGGNVHHSEAKCTDGSLRSGSGRVNGSWSQ